MKVMVLSGGDRERVELIKASLDEFNSGEVQLQIASSKEDGLACVEKGNQDLIIVCPPGSDGNLASAIVDLRRITEAPVVYIGAGSKNREVDVCNALFNGADGYIVLPSGLGELQARLFAVMRRSNDRIDLLKLDGFVIDLKTYGVSWDGMNIQLTRIEFELFHFLVRNKDQVLSVESIRKQIWPEHTGSVYNLVKKYVQKIRGKLGDDGKDSRWIVNLYGRGYRFIGPPTNTAV